uniref:DUF6824 domain-containing protein n=1 Tax=Cyclophora tenuis TaxID=216820 RepID=A0A7S1DCD2_CYCTE|mmetsp:Transcript_61/g.89  ORF Transcript_61/g.89 Transcript_61/m.89 type:complete len:226 (+) Transcript_61:2-679(+)
MAFNHVGNCRLRRMITDHIDRYVQANRTEKGDIITDMIDEVRRRGGHFIKRAESRGGRWIEVSDKIAREKIAHALRDAKAEQKKARRSNNSSDDEGNSSDGNSSNKFQGTDAKLDPLRPLKPAELPQQVNMTTTTNMEQQQTESSSSIHINAVVLKSLDPTSRIQTDFDLAFMDGINNNSDNSNEKGNSSMSSEAMSSFDVSGLEAMIDDDFLCSTNDNSSLFDF